MRQYTDGPVKPSEAGLPTSVLSQIIVNKVCDVLGIIPFGVLMVLNWSIYRGMKMVRMNLCKSTISAMGAPALK